jgi:hypothetical protein
MQSCCGLTQICLMCVILLLCLQQNPLENVNGTMQGSWNGYVNDDDRALLKVCV